MAPPAGQIRPGRYLAVFALIVVVLYALVFFTGGGKATPKLGIDLQGGTRVTLTARSPDGADPSRESLNQARQIIETRVNGLGVSGAEVVLDGNNIVITVPGDQGDQAKSLGQTAKLGFRQVLNATAATPPASDQSGSTESSSPPASSQQPSGEQQPSGQAPSGQSPSTQPSDGTSPQGAGGSGGGAHQQADPGSSSPSTPSSTPSSTPQTSSGAPTPSADQNDQVSQEIQQAKALRQSEDPNIQQQALAMLTCSTDPEHPDPLIGNDDPNLPLVTCSEDGTAKYLLDKVFLEGSEISNAAASTNPNGPGFVVNLTFKSAGATTWADFTSANVGQQVAVVLDTKVVSAPQINQAILGGNTEISGNFNQAEAQQLANVLKYGSLPLSFASSEAETVSATLGLASLEAGLIAGGIGLALVIVYCLFYYRLLGVLTVLSLGLSGVVVYAVLVLLGRWMGFTLDLAGVAGFIIAIGITADSFVVFFERMKDEVREGRTFRSAVPRAWVRARRTILSADMVSFLASAVLYVLAVGQVKGFAFTLGMSTVLDLVVVFLVTHPLVALTARSKTLSSPKLSGLGAVRAAGNQRAASRSTAVKEA
ncbi:protein translocase subunit SecD [Goodfellowiella coeruleoviolacea]|uniref:Protein translocase subunit SecD n=1 Tax=Goodfellowiella coeruleoviolacea TaxID=334858 RepID=A0AAE3KLK1_9PSEU|nr:protein translocase subunit SecD [Goodfellowiella coeruleoviolacea]MCP2166628.1 preprotein translocase subunit SecD [Goodfellowiella coeruleoviolacea]